MTGRPRPRVRRTMLLALTVIAALAAIPAAVAAVGSSGEPAARAWIDDPLSGSGFAAGPVVVVAHATAPGGVSAMRLEVDGKVAQNTATGGAQLEMATFSWDPGGPGIFHLSVRGKDAGGDWGAPGATVVLVGPDFAPIDFGPPPEDVMPPPPDQGQARPPGTDTGGGTEPTTTTTTPTATTPTLPPPVCIAGIPSLGPPANGASTLTAPTLSWTYNDSCPAQSFVIVVLRNPEIPSRVERQAEVGTTSWKVDPPLLCGVTFYWKVAAVHDGAQGSFSSPYSFTTNAGRC